MLPLTDQPLATGLVWALALGCLFWTIRRFWRWLNLERQQQRSLVDLVNRELPQTQCGQCGFAGCRPYARAIAQGEAINKCPPGGEQTIARLSELLQELAEPLDPGHGQSQPPLIAVIREAECIGCTKCIQACPVDAILGGPKFMHTVITAECSGCDLCVEPCPVDCIDLVPLRQTPRQWRTPAPVAQAGLSATATTSEQRAW